MRSLLVLVMPLLACGYSWVGAGGPGALGRVVVQTPHNASAEGGIEWIVADALRREVLRRADARLSEDPDTADWVVSGTVLPIRETPSAFSSVVLALEYELTLSLDLRVRTPSGEEVVMDPRDLSESERYLASADVEAQRKNRDEALHRVSRLLAERFLDALSERAERARR
jgi:Lipopolysaccharide-assembly